MSSGSETDTDEETKEEELRKLHAVLETPLASRLPSTLITVKTTNGPTPVTKATTNEQLRSIRTALALNKLADEKFRQLEKALIDRLKECREKLSEVQACLDYKPEKQNAFRYITVGKPYFKDRDCFPPPDNEDTITMKNAGMYDVSEVASVPGWTVKDKSEFLHQMMKMSRNLKINALKSKLAKLKRESKQGDFKTYQKEILQVTKEIDHVGEKPLSMDLVLPIDEEYDWDTVAAALNRRHTAQEYRALWKLFLHPAINKKTWDKTEHAKLYELANTHRFQDWNLVAQLLNTGRTGYQCFVYYRTNMGSPLIGQKWTKEEEEYLRRIIEYYKEDGYIPWGKVAASMENRTKIQIYNKYSRLLEYRKGRFLAEEDAVLLTCVEKFGHNFRKIVNYLPGRSVAQLRTRYHVLQNSTRTSTVWTIDEDRKLVQLMANQDSNLVNYSTVTKFFPNKDRVQLRARYLTLNKWMKRHPNKDIAMAPRRGARRLGHGQGTNDLNLALENLKNRIQSEVENKKMRKITKSAPPETIEHAIITTLINERRRENEIKKQSYMYDSILGSNSTLPKKNETNLEKTLILLKAKLKKDLYEKSLYFLEYPTLTKEKPKPSVKVKSYSRKSSAEVWNLEDRFRPYDIWGKNFLTVSEYVFPPNYSTITGCRRLMALASFSKPVLENTRSNFQNVMRNNSYCKAQFEIFMDRFNTLFLWPMLLSNEGPKQVVQPLPVPKKYKDRRERLFGGPDVAIMPGDSSDLMHAVIDLDEAPMEDTEENLVKRYVGNDDFLYMEDDDSNNPTAVKISI